MSRRRFTLAVGGVAFVAAATALAFDMLPAGILPDPWQARPASDTRVPIAMLGDSDSHGYGDTIWYPQDGALRGGEFRAITWQWTEVLAHLRGEQLDLGDRGIYGGGRRTVALLEALGWQRRAPRKFDHRHNFALGGAHSADLHAGPYRQVPRLLALMRREPERWRRGVVVVRIGILDLGSRAVLEAMAQAPAAAEVQARIDACVQAVADVVAAIRAEHPQTALVLVGVLDNTDCPPLSTSWSGSDLANIRRGLDRYDDGLRQLARSNSRVAFFDDRQWFRQRWGGRAADGTPSYQLLHLGTQIAVEHGCGDEPTHSVLADGHAGLVWNALWSQSLTQLLAQDLALPITAIADGEVEQLLRSLYAAWR